VDSEISRTELFFSPVILAHCRNSTSNLQNQKQPICNACWPTPPRSEDNTALHKAGTEDQVVPDPLKKKILKKALVSTGLQATLKEDRKVLYVYKVLPLNFESSLVSYFVIGQCVKTIKNLTKHNRTKEQRLQMKTGEAPLHLCLPLVSQWPYLTDIPSWSQCRSNKCSITRASVELKEVISVKYLTQPGTQ